MFTSEGEAPVTSTEPRPDLALAILDAPETPASRRGMREQVAELQERLRRVLEADWAPEVLAAAAVVPVAERPRLLDLGELERVRDDLVASLDAVRGAVLARRERHAANRALLERMFDDPDAHRGVRLTTDDLGLPGCCRWQVTPVLGLVGRLAGWWRVKVSSGCP
ncbi:hypothetical protein GCM10023201_37000 [Actinomycetospora corticicola]|uniref:Uncharacterized protein n=1 Tax=Actinomycetospora corticicola TaxID=663602 RepID=A0A7Y9J7N1_9PSEU|nr:hypothetical protein [Actinomycetospora corticicola]NYD38196.1 hypothetical protein [Actinomycetospora corticicola]